MLVLVLALGISAASCQTSGSGDNGGGKYTDVVPGGVDEVSAEVIEALTKSGTVKTYVFTDEDTAGRPLNLGGFNSKDFKEFFSEVYGGEIDVSITTNKWEGWESTFITDFAANDAPDLIYGFAKLWPKIANRGMVYSNNELKEKGIVGLDHPLLQDGFEAVEANFTFKDEVYGFALHRSGCFWSIVNEDLFKQYGVKSPSKYYEEGIWDVEALKKSSNELITAAGIGDSGVRDIFGYYCWDSTSFVRANGQQIVGYDPKTGTLSNNIDKTEVLEALENLRGAFQDGWATTKNTFSTGKIGVLAVTDENIVANVKDLTFNWSIIPYPKGKSNSNNQLPGSVSAWMVTTSSDNAQGVVNLVIAYYHAIELGILKLGDNCVESYFKDKPDTLQMIMDSKIHGVNDNMYGVGNLWSAQWDFWSPLRASKGSISEVVATYKPMFDAQIAQEMANAQ